eukprot:TRINITY_DN3322_c0_g1_i2.p1 TRINITY_DN3322_c0_g1~~TRINITY_DN3322_c0_g1_i2.p1  ORF type:complete len:384 (+),score=88.93 TRINITY_DN3322_c0_g1_i2:678-1829(+)
MCATAYVLIALIGLSQCCLSSAQGLPALSTVFSAYSGYPPCYRQPVLVIPNPETVLAFAEGRNNSFCSGTIDGYPKYIQLRRSLDGGATWGSVQEIFAGNVDYLGAVFDADISRVFLFIQNGSGVAYTTSDDLGATWLTPVAIELPYKGSMQPSVAHGVQLRSELCTSADCGGAVGRIVMPFVCHGNGAEATGDIACPGCFSCLILSDDHGKTWQFGAKSAQEGTRESSVVQLNSSQGGNSAGADVYASERNMGDSTGYRLHARSTDSGKTFSAYGKDYELPDSDVPNWTGCVAGLARFDTAGAPKILFSAPTNKTVRAQMAVFTSFDEAHTWGSGRLVYPNMAGYSDVFQLNATHAAILFENGETEFAARISFAVFDAAFLE